MHSSKSEIDHFISSLNPLNIYPIDIGSGKALEELLNHKKRIHEDVSVPLADSTNTKKRRVNRNLYIN
jgi:hypothetical protein